jgi:squalene-hopene/tetraprenyl-beta-curcumene cyclase
MSTVAESKVADAAIAGALGRAVGHLLSLQDEAGWWKGELETNVTMDAEDLLLRQFLGIRTEEQTRLSAHWIRSQQREDGTWASFFGGPPDHAATIEAYAALRLAGDPVDAEHMRLAREYVLDQGGLERARVFTKIWLSLFGLWSWEHVPAMPPELIYLPPWAPLNLYDFACWARQTVAALTVVWAYRPVREIPISLDELRVGGPPQTRFPVTDPVAKAFVKLDRALHVYERKPVGFLRRRALRKVERWILQHQEPDGCWGGIQPPWVYSIMALTLRGYPLEHPVVKRAIDGLDGFTIVDDKGRRLEACQSPVWDTCLAMIALADAGLPPDHPALVRAADWLVGEEITIHGDWAVRKPDLTPGGWAFEFENHWYPDIDDTAEVVMALRRAAQTPELDASARRGAEWTLGMKSANGAWAAFDADNTSSLVARLPFCDFGEVTDPPSVDVTAHVVEMLAKEGMPGHPDVQGGVDYLLQEQETDGSWFGRWGANYVYGTGAAVPALVEAGIPTDHQSIRRAVAWLEHVQNDDGGWGEDLRSYVDPSDAGRGESTASQTAWALLALHAAGELGEPARRGVEWLVRTQLPDGGWDEPWFTGTGFPGDFYINYHLYRLVWPVSALGRYAGGVGMDGGGAAP